MNDLMALHRVCFHQAWSGQWVRIRQCIHKWRGGNPSPCSTLISSQGTVAPTCGRSRTLLLQLRTRREFVSKKKNKNRSLHYIKVSLKDECMRNIHSYIPYRLVMELDMATAVQTPLPLPDMSSPSSNFVYFSFISSISEREEKPSSRTRKHNKEHQLNRSAIRYLPPPLTSHQ